MAKYKKLFSALLILAFSIVAFACSYHQYYIFTTAMKNGVADITVNSMWYAFSGFGLFILLVFFIPKLKEEPDFKNPDNIRKSLMTLCTLFIFYICFIVFGQTLIPDYIASKYAYGECSQRIPHPTFTTKGIFTSWEMRFCKLERTPNVPLAH